VPTTTTPPAPAWGNGDAGPKKTLKQIQEEEEKRKAKVAQQANQARAAVAPTAASKRGYADLAANVSDFGWLLPGSH
jgi:PERQ amino acid-rich with GYF domain-containing protein